MDDIDKKIIKFEVIKNDNPDIPTQEWDLDEEETVFIQKLFSKIKVLKEIIKECNDEKRNSDQIIDILADLQITYDLWFINIANKFKVVPKPEQKWSIDFSNKKAKLIG